MRYLWVALTATMLLVASPAHAGCDERSTPGVFVFPNDKAVSAFLDQLKTSVSAWDEVRVASLVAYPFYAHVHGRRVRIDRRHFSAYYHQIFNNKVRSALASAEFRSKADHACVFWNGSGMMVGDGELWLNVTDGGIKVTAVNN